MNNDDVVWFVNFYNMIGEFLVYVIIVCLFKLFCMIIGGFMLFVVEKGVEVVFSIVFLVSLVFEFDVIFKYFVFVG